jgi:16S rRNA G527 N7-methylase RsmG
VSTSDFLHANGEAQLDVMIFRALSSINQCTIGTLPLKALLHDMQYVHATKAAQETEKASQILYNAMNLVSPNGNRRSRGRWAFRDTLSRLILAAV